MPGTLAGLPNAQLLARVRELVQRGNAVEAELLAHLAEVDARQLYLEEGCSSMFVTNCAELIRAACHQSADEVRQLLANREPRHAPPTLVRRIPEPASPPARATVLPQAAPAPREQPAPPPPAQQTKRALTEPLGAERYRVQFVADRALYEQLQELRALMRHRVPDGDLGKILARAVAGLLAQVRKQKFAETSTPRAAQPSQNRNENPSRHVPAVIRRAVAQRDGRRCTYVSSSGRRCDSQEFLEFDHADAWPRTRAHSIDGITLRCRAHNQQRARIDFGEPHMARFHRRSVLNAAASALDSNHGAARGGDDQAATGFESSY